MQIEFDKITFDDSNPEPRCPVVLLLDTSGSMAGEPIDELNKGIARLAKELKNDRLASMRVELAVLTFGGEVKLVQDFVTAIDFSPPVLAVNGNTPMGEAIASGIRHLEQRKATYRAKGCAYYRPWLFLVTDGEPTDGERWMQAAELVHAGEKEKKLIFFAVCTDSGNIDTLSKISSRQPLRLKGLEFEEMFVWLSSSLSGVSSSTPGDKVALPAPSGWAEV